MFEEGGGELEIVDFLDFSLWSMIINPERYISYMIGGG